MLGKKLKRKLLIKTGIALTLLSHPRPKPNFPVLQGNGPCSLKKLVLIAALCLFFHLVK
jgi:hypothetical protein